MAVTKKCPPWVWGGDPCQLRVEQVASSQTYTVGTPVQKYGGYVQIAENSDSAADESIYGFVYSTVGTAVAAGTEIYVAVINVNQLWGIWVSNSDSDSAAAQTIVGNQYGHYVQASSPYLGYTTLDLNLSTNPSMIVEDIVSNLNTDLVASAGTSPGAAVVRFKAAALDQLGS